MNTERRRARVGQMLLLDDRHVKQCVAVRHSLFAIHAEEAGALNILLIPFILISIFFFVATGMGIWSYNGRQHYKNDVDTITAASVQTADAQLNSQKDKEFAEKAKYPFDTYTSPAASGSVIIKYPKTWSAYVEEQTQGSLPVNGFFYPNFVPNAQDNTLNFALRVKVVQQTYDSVLQNYNPYVQKGTVTVQPYKPPNIPGIIGARLDGAVQTQKQGIMIVLPIRDKTLELWTESDSFKPDFLNIILPNFTFTP